MKENKIWLKSEFTDVLESHGIDTVCFFGYGLDFEDLRVGDSIFFSYAFMGKDRHAKCENDELNKDWKSYFENTWGWQFGMNDFNIYDEFIIVGKYERVYYKNPYMKGRYRLEECFRVKNKRTGEIKKLSGKDIDNCYLLFTNPK